MFPTQSLCFLSRLSHLIGTFPRPFSTFPAGTNVRRAHFSNGLTARGWRRWGRGRTLTDSNPCLKYTSGAPLCDTHTVGVVRRRNRDAEHEHEGSPRRKTGTP